MKKILVVILAIGLVIGIVGCSGVTVSSPLPIDDTGKLQSQITDLQNQLAAANGDKTQLQTKLDVAKKQLDDATTLDNSDWIFPAKVMYSDYRADVEMTYIIRVHNGGDKEKDFDLVAEPWSNCPKAITSWVTFDPISPLTLQSKETKDIAVTFSEPADQRFYAITKLGTDYTNTISQMANLRVQLDKSADNSTQAQLVTLQSKLKVLDATYGLSSKQLDILTNFGSSLTITRAQVDLNSWLPDMKHLIDIGLLVSDSQFEFITAFSEVTSGNIVSRNAIRWIISMSEYSK